MAALRMTHIIQTFYGMSQISMLDVSLCTSEQKSLVFHLGALCLITSTQLKPEFDPNEV